MRFHVGFVAFLTRSVRLRRDLKTLSSLASSSGETSAFTSSYHDPVMWKECISALMAEGDHSRRRVFVDGTLGGGGHSEALLHSAMELENPVVVFGCDVDPDALRTATERLAPTGNDSSLFIPVHSNFSQLSRQHLADALMDRAPETLGRSDLADQILQHGVDGILLDLGVSSYQINTAERGFAFQQDGPLDMRMNMDSGALTAADICNEMDSIELKRILSRYGDEPRAKTIAESIVRHRPLTRTKDLYDAVAAVTPEFVRKGRRMGRTASMARVFQSLRIVVNQEDVVLDKALTKMAPALIRPSGRLVVLSYHSMEDRATKRAMRDGTLSKREAAFNNRQKDVYGNYIGQPKPFRPIGKPQKASPEEIARNPRSRSATLRIAERLGP